MTSEQTAPVMEQIEVATVAVKPEPQPVQAAPEFDDDDEHMGCTCCMRGAPR
ncbi:MAG: hypothetical protein ACOYNL_07665 [Rickettsiales bacterium]